MGVFSTGSGGSVGGPATPMPRELEATAATEVAKMMLGVMFDSLDKPFSQIDAHTTWKYNANANNPTIPPLTRLRVVLAYAREADTTWMEEFNRLLDLLPADVKAELLAESRLPIADRNPAYGALDNLLGMIAKSMVWLRTVSQPMDPETVAISHIPQYQAMPEVSREVMTRLGAEILRKVRDYLDDVGHNDPHFDGLMRFTNDIEEALVALQSFKRKGGI